MFRTLMATPVCLPISQCIINTLCNICYLCQLLAAAARRNCAATLDKVSAATFDHDRGEWQTNETPRLVWVCQDMLLPSSFSETQSLMSPVIADARPNRAGGGGRESHLLK